MIKKIIRYVSILGLNGLLYLIKAKLQNKEVLCKVNKFDCKYPFSVRVPSTDVLTTKQIFIRLDYEFSVKTEPQIIVDAGANIGLAAIFFANKYQNAKIIAIEPEQSNFELLKLNVKPYPNIIPVHAALWDKSEEINIVDPGRGSWGFMTEKNDPSTKVLNSGGHSVIGMTVDEIMEYYKLANIDILKIDIEGAEKEVFSNTTSWIEDVETIIVELHEHKKAGCNRSFYCGSNGFDYEWRQGENIYLSRGNCLREYRSASK